MKALQENISLKIQFSSFMAGILTGFLTPNLIGNFIGRMFYFERKKRIDITILTLFSNLSQFSSSLIFGIISIVVIGFPADFQLENTTLMLIFLSLILILGLVLYFSLFPLLAFAFRKKQWMNSFKMKVEYKKQFLLTQLIFSLLRHLVFSFQFYFLLLCFGVKSDFMLLFLVWQVYLWSTLIPSLWLGKLFIRESIAIWILGTYTHQSEIVLLSSFVLWFINQGFPALISVPYFKFSKHASA